MSINECLAFPFALQMLRLQLWQKFTLGCGVKVLQKERDQCCPIGLWSREAGLQWLDVRGKLG